jgi:ubiquinone biosynthesis protein Coq4
MLIRGVDYPTFEKKKPVLTSAPALERMRAQMLASETGRLILAERPRVAERAPLELVAACAPGTFGRAYHDFMASHGFRPEPRGVAREAAHVCSTHVCSTHRLPKGYIEDEQSMILSALV